MRSGLFGDSVAPPRVGRYELLRCIGRGGMGIVYAARDVELGREVAIKLLRPELSHGGDGERLTSEARALARLSHPNVVSVFDVGTFEGQRFIAMEYVVGQDLRRWLEAPRRLRDLIEVFIGAGQGLHAAHQVGLVHRDFKPDNVLVGDDGRPRVLDFGLARPPDANDVVGGQPPAIPGGTDPLATVLTQAGQVIGTPAYMAPEQHLGEPADARSDQFSFAVALYHAVYGVRPFAGEDPQALALSIVRGRIRPATPRYPVPRWLEDLLARALAVDPAQRFDSMAALISLLETQLEAGTAELDVVPSRGLEAEPATASTAWHVDGFDSLAGPLPAVVSPPGALARPADPPKAMSQPSESDGGLTTSISTRRSIAGSLDDAALEILARELDRLEGSRGTVDRLGASMTWTTRSLEVHVDVGADRTEILVWRRLGRQLARRTARWMALGFFLSNMFIAMVAGSGALDQTESLIPIVVIGSLLTGLTTGYRKGRARHVRALPSARAHLDFVADRLVGLAQVEGQAALPSRF
ncbi:MAG: serine/threonine-protein kinase [Myxococcota bacterium]